MLLSFRLNITISIEKSFERVHSKWQTNCSIPLIFQVRRRLPKGHYLSHCHQYLSDGKEFAMQMEETNKINKRPKFGRREKKEERSQI